MGLPGPVGPGVYFDIVRVAADAAIGAPVSGHSVICLVTTPASNLTLTLPSPASASGRLIVIRRVDKGKRVIIRPQDQEAIEGARSPMTMDETFDAITLVTDGNEWVVLFR